MKKLTWRQSVVAVAFLLSLSLGIFFVVRAVRPAIYWHYHQDEPIRGWMTMGYVAHLSLWCSPTIDTKYS